MAKLPIRFGPSGEGSDAESEKPGDTVGSNEASVLGAPVDVEQALERWRDRALRLQAEKENYRKHVRRRAKEEIAVERERILRAFLGIADDLARALEAEQADAMSLRKGVEMTYRNLRRALEQEGASVIDALGTRFDPEWHEAVSTVPYREARVKPRTVVDVVEEGYRMGDRVLRPARVVVAV
jgi:molecular chaperone GrpE